MLMDLAKKKLIYIYIFIYTYIYAHVYRNPSGPDCSDNHKIYSLITITYCGFLDVNSAFILIYINTNTSAIIDIHIYIIWKHYLLLYI